MLPLGSSSGAADGGKDLLLSWKHRCSPQSQPRCFVERMVGDVYAPYQSDVDMFEKIPEEMQRFPQWICWQLKDVPDGKGGWRKTKIPFRVDGRPGSTTDPADWTTFERAAAALDEHPNLT